MTTIKLMCVCGTLAALSFSACKQVAHEEENGNTAETSTVTDVPPSSVASTDPAPRADKFTEFGLPETLEDTVGVYRITDDQARQFIVDFYVHIWRVGQAVDKKDKEHLPAMMTEVTRYQRDMGEISPTLAETDRTLFDEYTLKASRKLVPLVSQVSSVMQ